MSINFVSTTVLTSADGIHKEQRILESESPKGGLAVRNRDEEKLKAREGTNLTLYEQLQQNKEDKDVDWESQLRESRMPKALDDEEVAFLEEQDAKRTRALRQHEKQELDVMEGLKKIGQELAQETIFFPNPCELSVDCSSIVYSVSGCCY